MTRFLKRDLLGRLPVIGPGEPPCLNRHPWTGYGCQAAKDHPPPCRYYSERGWHVEWYPDRGDGSSRGAAMEGEKTPAELYLDLLKKCLTRYLFGEDDVPAVPPKGTVKYLASEPVRRWLAAKNMEIIRHVPFDEPTRRESGDLIEAGAWRGGATKFMRAVLAAFGDTERRVWVADSFRGLPRPDPERFPAEAGDEHWTWDQLAVSLEEVRANFERYGLLDDQVRFLPGWFRDRCRGRRSTAWPCSASTATCTAPPWTPWRRSTPSCRPAAM